LSRNTLENTKGFSKAVEILRPHWQEIDAQYEHDVQEYNLLFQKDSSLFGRIIKCHLVSEVYLEKYLKNKLSMTNLADVRLSYYQKVMLLPDRNEAPALFKPGLLTLNKLRNNFAHKLDSTLSTDELSTMTAMLLMSEPPVNTMNAIEMVEKFTALACVSLNPTPPKIKQLFEEAMKHIAVEIDQNDELA